MERINYYFCEQTNSYKFSADKYPHCEYINKELDFKILSVREIWKEGHDILFVYCVFNQDVNFKNIEYKKFSQNICCLKLKVNQMQFEFSSEKNKMEMIIDYVEQQIKDNLTNNKEDYNDCASKLFG